MVWGSRRIEPNRVTPQGFEEQGVSDATKGDHIDGAAEDLCEVLAKTHVAAEEVRRVVWKVHKHIDIAAAWVEVIARSRADQFKERHPAPLAGSSDAVEVVGDQTDHAESLPRKSANRNGQSRNRRGDGGKQCSCMAITVPPGRDPERLSAHPVGQRGSRATRR